MICRGLMRAVKEKLRSGYRSKQYLISLGAWNLLKRSWLRE